MIVFKNNGYKQKDVEILYHALSAGLRNVQNQYCNFDCDNCTAQRPCSDIARATVFLMRKLNG